ncbi:hypothetical protein HMPREF0495_01601 [Levilactobacillus brevis ATCC 14869 = DSM 20054]|uniref:Uncharacterized protein n=1 Tax=Levilactobacillus brevis ATCC 14869 = DSM 20054 TaxID=649758 RepID=U2QWX5_LEVBR|nr:hypothetical protein HMPREF0495_01601 [Levilactobacillus brevis ATCC 14869 = DSM 20054]
MFSQVKQRFSTIFINCKICQSVGLTSNNSALFTCLVIIAQFG